MSTCRSLPKFSSHLWLTYYLGLFQRFRYTKRSNIFRLLQGWLHFCFLHIRYRCTSLNRFDFKIVWTVICHCETIWQNLVCIALVMSNMTMCLTLDYVWFEMDLEKNKQEGDTLIYQMNCKINRKYRPRHWPG